MGAPHRESAYVAAVTQSTWVTLVVAGIPAIAAIIAAAIASRSARKTKRAETEAQRTRELESRNAEKKYEVYEPMINLLRDTLAQKQIDQDELIAKLQHFSTWVTIYGSDEAVETFHNFMQASYSDAPAAILLRLYGDFMIAIRKDIGYPDTDVSRQHLLGMRITDIYKSYDIINQSFEEICDRLNWKAPWLSSDVTPKNDR